MRIQSSRFGSMLIEQRDIIAMPHGLIGFEAAKHWVLLAGSEQDSVAWLQSIALEDVAVPVVAPRRFRPEYRVQIAERDMARLQLRRSDTLYVLAIVSRNSDQLTANLRSPILLNASRQLAVQVVTTNEQQLQIPIAPLAPATGNNRRAA